MPRGIEQLVNERVLMWEVERRSTVPPPPSGVREVLPAEKPMITISRECGSLGGELGRKVAERLGFAFYSQELVHQIATRARVHDAAVESFDEHPRGSLEVMVREMLDGEAFAAQDYFRHLRSVLRRLARNGRGVVVGRGGHLLLDTALTLKVRTYAPAEQRERNLAMRAGISRGDAAGLIRRVDRERAAFHRQHFSVDWSDPSLFDVCLNTARVPLEECVELVAAAHRSRFASSG